MTQVIRASITFEYNLDEDPYMEMFGEESTLEEKMQYVRETMAEDIRQMGYEYPMLEDSIDMEVVDVKRD